MSYFGYEGGTELDTDGAAKSYTTGYVTEVDTKYGTCTVMRSEGGYISRVPILGAGMSPLSGASTADKHLKGSFVLLRKLDGMLYVVDTLVSWAKPTKQVTTNSVSKSSYPKAKDSTTAKTNIDGAGDEQKAYEQKVPAIVAQQQQLIAQMIEKLQKIDAAMEDADAAGDDDAYADAMITENDAANLVNAYVAEVDPTEATAITANTAISALEQINNQEMLSKAVKDKSKANEMQKYGTRFLEQGY